MQKNDAIYRICMISVVHIYVYIFHIYVYMLLFFLWAPFWTTVSSEYDCTVFVCVWNWSNEKRNYFILLDFEEDLRRKFNYFWLIYIWTIKLVKDILFFFLKLYSDAQPFFFCYLFNLRNKFILEIAFSLLTRIISTPRIKGGRR